MKSIIGVVRISVVGLGIVASAFGALIPYTGNSYTSPNTRATWTAQMTDLDYTSINFLTECVSPCAPTYNSGPASTTNISGTIFSGVTFAGANSNSGAGLFLRPIGSRNTFYNGLTANGAYTQWTNGLATAQGVTGGPSMTITLPTGTRSAGFDFGNINSTTAGITITATTAGGHLDTSPGRYDVAAGSPSYASTGPGFYGVTSSTEDILTISIVANASSNQWVLNLANFRFGVILEQATPEPSPQLTLGVALITISLLLRLRSKSARGGNA